MNRSTVAISISSVPRRALWLAALLVGCVLVPLADAPPAAAQQGARVKMLNFADLVGYSGVILRGRVLSVTAEKHPELTNLNTVVVTLQVSEVLKGEAGAQYTFRQYTWDARDASSRLGYKNGEDVLLMLLPPSQYGLSSPVGFEQGRFRFQADSAGNISVRNGWNNLGLMRGVGASLPKLGEKVSASARLVAEQHRDGPIPYNEFKELVRGAIAARQ